MEKKWILASIIFLGLALRILALGQESFWLDEASVVVALEASDTFDLFKNSLLYGKIVPGYWEDYNTYLPTYFVVLSIWIKLFTISEFSVRLLSVVFGVLALFMMYVCAKELTNVRVAIIATMLLSVSVVAIEYSQETRPYSLVLLLAILSSYLFAKSSKDPNLKNLVAFTMVNIIGLYTHFTYVFFVSSQGAYFLYMLLRRKKEANRIFFAFAVMGLSFIPLLIRIFSSVPTGGGWVSSPTIVSITKVGILLNAWIYPSSDFILKIKAFDILSFSISEFILIGSFLVLVGLLASFFLYGMYSLIQKKHERSMFLLIWFFAPIVLALILSFVHPTAKVFGPIRYLIFIVPVYIIITSVGIASAPKKYLRPIVVCILLASIFPLGSYYVNENKVPWEEIAIHIEKQAGEDHMILINNPNKQLSFDYYYNGKGKVVGASDVTQVKETLEGTEQFWLILSGNKYTDPTDSIKNYVEDTYVLQEKTEFFDATVYYFSEEST